MTPSQPAGRREATLVAAPRRRGGALLTIALAALQPQGVRPRPPPGAAATAELFEVGSRGVGKAARTESGQAAATSAADQHAARARAAVRWRAEGEPPGPLAAADAAAAAAAAAALPTHGPPRPLALLDRGAAGAGSRAAAASRAEGAEPAPPGSGSSLLGVAASVSRRTAPRRRPAQVLDGRRSGGGARAAAAADPSALLRGGRTRRKAARSGRGAPEAPEATSIANVEDQRLQRRHLLSSAESDEYAEQGVLASREIPDPMFSTMASAIARLRRDLRQVQKVKEVEEKAKEFALAHASDPHHWDSSPRCYLTRYLLLPFSLVCVLLHVREAHLRGKPGRRIGIRQLAMSFELCLGFCGLCGGFSLHTMNDTTGITGWFWGEANSSWILPWFFANEAVVAAFYILITATRGIVVREQDQGAGTEPKEGLTAGLLSEVLHVLLRPAGDHTPVVLASLYAFLALLSAAMMVSQQFFETCVYAPPLAAAVLALFGGLHVLAKSRPAGWSWLLFGQAVILMGVLLHLGFGRNVVFHFHVVVGVAFSAVGFEKYIAHAEASGRGPV